MVSLEIAGVDRTDLLRDATLSGEKSFGFEEFELQVLDLDSTSGAYRPTVNQDFLLYHNADLLGGGLIVGVQDQRLIDGQGTLTTVRMRDWSIVLDRIIVSRTIAEGDALAILYALFVEFLQPKGFTWISGTSGGPTVVEATYDHQPLAQIFTDVCERAERFWRVNGLQQMAVVAAGDLTGDALTEDDILDAGDVWEQVAADQATRLFIRTGGSGVVTHSESRIADGTQTRWHLNVEPRPTQLEPEVISYAPTTVTENGTPHTIGDGRWAYDADEHAIYIASGAPPSAGHVITTGGYQVEFPAWVRVWTDDATDSLGDWDYAEILDAVIQAGDKTDLAQTAEWGRIELTRRNSTPKVRTCSTYKPGYYPLLRIAATDTARLLSGNFLITTVRFAAVGIDPDTTTDDLLYTLELVEGDALPPTWRQGWQARGATSVGGTSVLGGGNSAEGGSGSGTVGYPVGHTQPLGGDNYNAYTATTTWQDWPHFPPTRHGGAGMAGDWLLRTPMYQMSAGTLEARLINQADSSVIASTSTTQTGTLTNQNWAFETDAYAAPSSVLDVILQFRVTSGSRKVKLGQATLVKTS